MTENIRKTACFLREKLAENPENGDYRLAHTMRVARIGAAIARAEGLDEEAMTVACLLHDISYCRPFTGEADWKEHGRASAAIARPFLETLALTEVQRAAILYGIAAHVDDRPELPGEPSPFTGTVADADNIDRFDAFRIYETLNRAGYETLSPDARKAHLAETLAKLRKLRGLPFTTKTAAALWRQRLGDWIHFYERLLQQNEDGRFLLEEEITARSETI